MAVLAEERARPTVVELTPVADPAPLGLGAFALTTFVLSAHNAGWFGTVGNAVVIGLALFYGGLAQFCAGMWEFKNRNTFGATAFSTYGGFWLALGIFVVLAETTKLGGALVGHDLDNGLAWFLLSFAIFNTYMMLWSLRVNVAVFGVFLTLEITELLLTIGNFRLAHGGTPWILHAGGWAGIVTAGVAWYTSAAGVVNGMSPRPVLPVGRPMWDRLPLFSQLGSPMPRRTEA